MHILLHLLNNSFKFVDYISDIAFALHTFEEYQ